MLTEKIQICLNKTHINEDRRSASFSCTNYKGNLHCLVAGCGEYFKWIFPAWIGEGADKNKYQPCKFYKHI